MKLIDIVFQGKGCVGGRKQRWEEQKKSLSHAKVSHYISWEDEQHWQGTDPAASSYQITNLLITYEFTSSLCGTGLNPL